jgi:lysyl-tRNA synthetase class 2
MTVSGGSDWRPTATIEALRVRAEVLASIRAFFAERDVLEVETPVLAASAVTDRHLRSMATSFSGPGSPAGRTLHLQTSPEFHMKRLLAASSGPIWQLGKAFRDGEAGRRHNPEFTLLEWYRPGWDHHQLMDEVDELLGRILNTRAADRSTYGEAFRSLAGLDPFRSSPNELRSAFRELVGAEPPDLGPDREGWLELLFSHVLEPELGRDRPTFIHDYPATQAALARVRPGDPPLAERFEVFVEGMELANGFHELGDAAEQRRRFERDRDARRSSGLPVPDLDERLLASLSAGLPDCAGVALGVDRLVMLKLGARDISEVIAFPIDRA